MLVRPKKFWERKGGSYSKQQQRDGYRTVRLQSLRLISRFTCLIDALDAILQKGADQDVKGVRDELLQPDLSLIHI